MVVGGRYFAAQWRHPDGGALLRHGRAGLPPWLEQEAVESWSKEAVHKWVGIILGGIYQPCADGFLFEGIDGEELLRLSVEDLMDCGVTEQRDQNRILNEIRKLEDSRKRWG